MTSVINLELPRYSASVPTPEYSFEPACGERTLEETPRSLRPVADSTYIKHSGKTTVVLHSQEENAKMPSYGREATISGSVLFDSSDNICEVDLEILGKVETMSSDSGTRTTTVVDNKRVLWSRSQKGGHCPCQIEFTVRLPSTFRDDQGEARPLPPTYAADFHGVPGLCVRSCYLMQILITRRRSGKLGFLNKTKRILIPFEYYPRTRPHGPIVPSPCFYSGVKTTPEEWHQTIASMTMPQNVDCGPIYTHLLIPSVRMYSIRDTIPFHVQLGGSEMALRAFLQPKKESSWRKRDGSGDNRASHNVLALLPVASRKEPSPRTTHSLADAPELSNLGATNTRPPSLVSPPSSRTISYASSPQHLPLREHLLLEDATRPTLRVFLLRQVALETRSGKKSWRNQILGEAKLATVPPLLSTSCYSPNGVAEPQEDHLDWEGELQINERFNIGGWQAAGVHVKDFIALSVVPHNEQTSPLHGIQLTVPVKLVTDPWIEGANGFAVPLET